MIRLKSIVGKIFAPYKTKTNTLWRVLKVDKLHVWAESINKSHKTRQMIEKKQFNRIWEEVK